MKKSLQNSKKPISEEEFMRLVRAKMYQLKRSKLYKKKIEKELEEISLLNSNDFPEFKDRLRKYIEMAGDLSVAEQKQRNLQCQTKTIKKASEKKEHL